MNELRIRADYILVNPRTLIFDGLVTVSPNQIVRVDIHRAETIDIDFGHALLLPGFVNAHTHLEFSDMAIPFDSRGSFPEWIGQVVRSRRESSFDLTHQELIDKHKQALFSGALECYSTGTIAIADIATSVSSVAAYVEAVQKVHRALFRELGDRKLVGRVVDKNSTRRFLAAFTAAHIGPRLLPFTEVLGLQQDRFQEMLRWSQQFQRELEQAASDSLIDWGFSPHSPYSISRENFLTLSQTLPAGKMIAVHVAESLDEREWLDAGEGAFLNAFRALGMEILPERTSIAEVLESLKRFERSLVIHGNYLTADEMDQIAGNPSASVVYCPRTHKHFQHADYPYVELKRRNIPVLIGTDSRASSPNLSLWEDLLEARRSQPQFEASDALAAITSLAAERLGIARKYGSIEAGKSAQFNVLPLESFDLPKRTDRLDLLARITQGESADPTPKPWLISLLE